MAFPAGEVRINFLSMIERILREQQDRRFTALQQVRLNGFAQRFFSTGRMHDQPDELAMLTAWRGAVG
jgi:hypothetical protein